LQGSLMGCSCDCLVCSGDHGAVWLKRFGIDARSFRRT
jgi:hypothetical protein